MGFDVHGWINKRDNGMSNHMVTQRTTVFFDTMVFLHCVPIQNIDLVNLLGAKDVKVVIPRITVQELDKHKNTHQSEKIRKRASQRLKDISNWNDESDQSEICHNVTVSLLMNRPKPDSFREGLDKSWADDELIAAILEYTQSNEYERVVLVSHDTGPKLTARQFGIETMEVPDKWRIPPEDDPLMKENKRLKKELLDIQNSRPDRVVRRQCHNRLFKI